MINYKMGMISVIVPVYNVEQYLQQCLDSLLGQTYKNIEVIMVDDGSEDSSGQICEEYVKQYSNFKVVHKTNMGLGMARNTGLEHINGEYVTFVDSDDWLEKDLLSRLYKGIVENQVDFCKSGFRRVNDNKKTVKLVQYNDCNYYGNKARLEMLPRMVGSSPFQHDSIEMCVCGSLYKTEIIKKYGIKFPSERELISEDLVFNIDYMQHTDGGVLISYVGYCYRVNPNSLTLSYRSDRFEAVIHFYKEITKKLEGYDYGGETITRLQRLFFVYIRMCITQESKKISKLTYIKSLGNLKEICSNDIVSSVIESYPVDKLGFKQRVFIFLIYHKCVHLLKLMTDKGII